MLVVDDNATNRLILSEMTRGWGMNPTTAEDGQTALAILKKASASGTGFPLVLLDAMMPGMDGFTLAQEIQAHPELARATIMMLTSADRLGDAGRCKELGIASYLTKPLKASELLDAIVKLMGTASLCEAAWAGLRARRLGPGAPPMPGARPPRAEGRRRPP